jgi:hypothetical protein
MVLHRPFEPAAFVRKLPQSLKSPGPNRGTPVGKTVATMSVLDNAEKAQAHGNAVGVRFVLIELDTGLLFCKLAFSSDSELDARRNEALAKRSYDAAVHHVKPLLLSKIERRAFDDKKERLRLLL